MAINWDIKITDVNMTTKRAMVTATRTDTESSLSPQTYSFHNTPIGTSQERVSLLNTIKHIVEEDAADQTAIDAVVADLERDGKSSLEAWELTR